jgi:hypothetical protein
MPSDGDPIVSLCRTEIQDVNVIARGRDEHRSATLGPVIRSARSKRTDLARKCSEPGPAYSVPLHLSSGCLAAEVWSRHGVADRSQNSHDRRRNQEDSDAPLIPAGDAAHADLAPDGQIKDGANGQDKGAQPHRCQAQGVTTDAVNIRAQRIPLNRRLPPLEPVCMRQKRLKLRAESLLSVVSPRFVLTVPSRQRRAVSFLATVRLRSRHPGSRILLGLLNGGCLDMGWSARGSIPAIPYRLRSCSNLPRMLL